MRRRPSFCLDPGSKSRLLMGMARRRPSCSSRPTSQFATARREVFGAASPCPGPKHLSWQPSLCMPESGASLGKVCLVALLVQKHPPPLQGLVQITWATVNRVRDEMAYDFPIWPRLTRRASTGEQGQCATYEHLVLRRSFGHRYRPKCLSTTAGP